MKIEQKEKGIDSFQPVRRHRQKIQSKRKLHTETRGEHLLGYRKKNSTEGKQGKEPSSNFFPCYPVETTAVKAGHSHSDPAKRVNTWGLKGENMKGS